MASIKIIKDGPAIISGEELELEQDNGIKVLMQTIAICRCGRSKKGLTCDGSHTKKWDD